MKGLLAFSLLSWGVLGYVSIAMAQSPGTFTATGNMITPRFGHTATLLPNGKVLIAGGATICGPPRCVPASVAELYDPETGVFTATGSMNSVLPSGGILLADGRVFFAGSDVKRTVPLVEVYDPSSGEFNVIGNPATLTIVIYAVGLNDGRVLVTGFAGVVPMQRVSAEIYDPSAGTFSPVANWPAQNMKPLIVFVDGRVFFDSYGTYDPATGESVAYGPSEDIAPSATLLRSGAVLFAGGGGCGGHECRGASLYNPATGMFEFEGLMSTARVAHSATLLSDGTVLVAGGAAGLTIFASADLYDPVFPVPTVPCIQTDMSRECAGRFSATASMTLPRWSHTATLLNNGQVLITGGSTVPGVGSFSGTSSAELYTPAVLIPSPVLFSLSGDGRGQGAIWHATTGEIASPSSPAVAGEATPPAWPTAV